MILPLVCRLFYGTFLCFLMFFCRALVRWIVMNEIMKVQETFYIRLWSCSLSFTCMNPSGHPGSSAPEVANMRLTSVLSKSLSATPSSNLPTVKPSKMICEVEKKVFKKVSREIFKQVSTPIKISTEKLRELSMFILERPENSANPINSLSKAEN